MFDKKPGTLPLNKKFYYFHLKQLFLTMLQKMIKVVYHKYFAYFLGYFLQKILIHRAGFEPPYLRSLIWHLYQLHHTCLIYLLCYTYLDKKNYQLISKFPKK